MIPLRECPRCQRRYSRGEEFCGSDGTPLRAAAPEPLPVPYNPRAFAGRTIGGRFVLRELIGSTATAVVYRAQHKDLERDFAVKLLLLGLLRDRRAQSRFLREAKVASSVDHPNIVNIYDFGQTEHGEPYLVMELIDGVTLRQVLQQSAAGRLPLGQALDIVRQTARGLAHAHSRGVVHRNIKPENIALIDRDGLQDFVKILDFGVAKLAGQPTITQKGEVLGTAEFIAPEAWQWGEESEAEPAVDLYALGVLLYFTIAGKPPFFGEPGDLMLAHLQREPPRLSAHSQTFDIPRELDELALRLLAKDPRARPAAEETAGTLERIQAQLPPQSLRSLLLQKTLILQPAQRNTSRLGAPPTVILDRPGRETVVLDRPQKEARPGPLDDTAQGPVAAVLGQIDVLEAELERARRRLAEHAEALAGRLWHVWPPEVRAARDRITALEAEEDSQGIQMAVLGERLRQREEERHARLAALRQRILALSETLRAEAPEDAVNGTDAALRAAEQAYDQAAREGDDGLRQALDDERERLHALRGELQRQLAHLSRLILAAPAPPELQPERRRVEQLLDQMEKTGATLLRLMDTHRPKPG